MAEKRMLPVIKYNRKGITDEELLKLYRALLFPRMIEEKMLVLLRQGRVSKWFSCIGQEAISVGLTEAMDSDEYILPLHRNLGVFTSRRMPLAKLIAQWQGKRAGFSKGRERSFHFGSTDHHIVGMISHLGPQLAVGSGIALAHILKREKKITAAFSGEGGTSEGDFHEALNTAAVWDLPIIFVIENNGYGLSTPTADQFRCANLADKGIGYGMEAITIDGNNILEVYSTVKKQRATMLKNPKPLLLECKTFRMRGHEEASGTKYVPKALINEWALRDPLQNYETYLLTEKLISEKQIAAYRAAFKKEIEQAVKEAFELPDIVINDSLIAEEIEDLYHPHIPKHSQPTGARTSKRFIDAITDGLGQAMEIYPDLILMGQDIAGYGGVFKITEGFVSRFGEDRVRNTTLCESAIIGIGLGLSIKKMKAMVEMQFADFVTCGFNQIINNLSKIHYRWGQNADVVVRMPTGAGVGAGPFHSQSNEAWFFHSPGIKIVYPSSVYDAKGLLLSAFDDPNPVMFFEHKALYRSLTEDIPDEPYYIEIGKANLLREGSHLTIITYGMGVHWAIKALDNHPEINAELLDLRSLLPYDRNAILLSVNKTGKAIILHEDSMTGGIGAEIAALISRECFEKLDAPVIRTAALDTPIPFAIPLEQNYLPSERFEKDLLMLYNY